MGPGIIYLIVTKLLNDRNENTGVVGLMDTLSNSIPIIKNQCIDDITARLNHALISRGCPVLSNMGREIFNIDMRNSNDRSRYRCIDSVAVVYSYG